MDRAIEFFLRVCYHTEVCELFKAHPVFSLNKITQTNGNTVRKLKGKSQSIRSILKLHQLTAKQATQHTQSAPCVSFHLQTCLVLHLSKLNQLSNRYSMLMMAGYLAIRLTNWSAFKSRVNINPIRCQCPSLNHNKQHNVWPMERPETLNLLINKAHFF